MTLLDAIIDEGASTGDGQQNLLPIQFVVEVVAVPILVVDQIIFVDRVAMIGDSDAGVQ